MQAFAAQPTSPAQPKLAGPLYNQIQLLMRERILAREWRDGKNLPTEVELAREYSVSLGTMRKALDVLEDAKFIVRKQGLGTFVRDIDGTAPKQFGWAINGKISAESVVRVISNVVSDASGNESAALNLAGRSKVQRVKLVSAIERRAFILDEYVIPDGTGFVVSGDANTVPQALQALERQATRFAESFAVESVAAPLSQILRTDVGAPALRIERCAMDAKGRPLYLCIRLAHLDGVRYQVEVDNQ